MRRGATTFRTVDDAREQKAVAWADTPWSATDARRWLTELRRLSRLAARSPLLLTFLLLSSLTAIVTWPQAVYLGSRVVAHDDPYLSLWRLSWIAHVLPSGLTDLANANIFYPSRGTFAYTDMTLLEGIVAAPWLWAGVNPVLVYNVMLLGGMVASGLSMFVLVRHLTDSDHAALVSAVIFTLAPYRITHFVHLELQWTMWMPLTFWAVHRTFETGSYRMGGLVGLFLSLQLLSCVYYGAFLGILVALLCVLLGARSLGRARLSLGPLALGAVVAAVTAVAYARPYVENTQALGMRDAGEIASFSARLVSYATAPYVNWLWGWTGFRFEGDELHLFLGLVACGLGVVALIAAKGASRPIVWTYFVLFGAAVELSLGLNGTVYRWLHETFFVMQGFRAPARFGILAVAALAVLAGFGARLVEARAGTSGVGRAWLVALLVAIGVEYGSAPTRLEPVPRETPDLYRFLKTVEPGPLLELPLREPAPVYMYWSKEHWLPLVNGYSGHASPTFGETAERVARFPDARSIAHLRALGVRYVVIHQAYYPETRYTPTLLELMRSPDFVPLGRYRDWVGTAEVFSLTPDATP